MCKLILAAVVIKIMVSQSTMPAIIAPCVALKAFDFTFYNGISTTPYTSSSSSTTTIPFPAGFVFATDSHFDYAILRYNYTQFRI